MSGALLNLVRLNPANETSPDHDYTSGEIFERHEEIKLVTPDGDPCAIPMPARFENIDHKYNYITGAKGHQTRGIRRDLSINIDYIGNETSRRLEHWMHQRARVLVAPNWGRNTEFSFRPVNMLGPVYPGGGTVYDLTGNHAYDFTAGTFDVLLWDYVARRFMKKSLFDHLPLSTTPGGAGFRANKSMANRSVPTFPHSATMGAGSGKSGWFAGGSDVSQLSFSHDATGFGHPDCPASLKVSFDADTSVSRYIYKQSEWDSGSGNYQGYTFTGGGQLAFVVWVRGTLPDATKILIAGPSGTTTREIFDFRADGWAPLIINHTEADWSLGIPLVQINLNASESVAGSFEVGPVMVHHKAGSVANPDALWINNPLVSGIPALETVGNLSLPSQGVIHCSFMLPEWYAEAWAGRAVFDLVGGSDWYLAGGRTSGGVLDYVIVHDSVTGDEILSVAPTAGSSFRAGQINTVSYVWGPDRQQVYINGAPMTKFDRNFNDVGFGGNTSPLRIGGGSVSQGSSPADLLTLRIDEGTPTDAEVENIHLALTDPIALQFAMTARGRVYKIVGIPQTVRASADGSQVLGTIQLEQVDYHSWLSDPMNPEETVL